MRFGKPRRERRGGGHLEQKSGDDAVHHEGDGFDVITASEYTFRTNSDLQLTVIIEREEPERATVTMLAGGGGSGLLRFDWGSESSRTESLRSTLKDVCESLGLTVHADDE